MPTILITGCTVGGLGFEAACQILASSDASTTLILTVRTELARANALTTLHALSPTFPSRVTIHLLDLSSFQSVRTFCSNISSPINTILCNAGTIETSYTLTGDGHERQFQVNYLSHFLLIYTILSTLIAQPSARIVLVSSDMHFSFMNTDPTYLQYLTPAQPYNGMTVYGHTKYLENALAQYLARHLPPHVTVNTVTPGLVPTTAMADKSSWFDRFLARYLLLWLGIAVSKEVGGKRLVEVAVGEVAEGVMGKYWARSQPMLPRKEALDEEVQEKLWKLSCDIVGVDAAPLFLKPQ
ncbi:hypothetical protein HDV00_008354 [Rhizophlyctis rosea]|nr:hypothetical protein HDV00_008354 [Rhizophlyctis rosea]